ncbi:acyl carrier protein [Neptunomonas qingdaonensis]|uniref:Acyl carrier protein n=1 Tax=Neptunomonas qingdaonensis TaxID=1045558 RepID=A0A1I2V8X4_9GAMM|nr:acyl carrier protein [Neptunomonas qingdaonensis]SFG83621.1 acyl carrier protein [Neptunomonas qingdaonensis]
MDTKQLRELILTELCNIAPEIEKDEVPDDQDFREALELDSMDFLSLVIAVSQQTKVNIPEVDYPKVLTLNDMINYINNN